MTNTKISRGCHASLGANTTERGVNFALYSAHASGVELCLFNEAGAEQRVDVTHCTDGIWHAHIDNLGAGQLYGYRVHGAWMPEKGQRFNPAKLLLDPYARRLTGSVRVEQAHFDYLPGQTDNLVMDHTDSGPHQPRCVVGKPMQRLERSMRAVPLSEMLVYEMHVKGFTQRHPGVPEDLAGSYGGLASHDCLKYLVSLGVTTVELLPVQEFTDEPFLVKRDLTNYWGYNSISFFVPTRRYALGDPADDFRDMVRAFHDVNIEVILDVVYNHTAEGGKLGPTFSFRGIDNASYYRLENGGDYINDSGCGNSLNIDHPAVLRMVMDSLRYWVTEMGVDGFRFDLAASLGRTQAGYSREAAFFKAVHQDPVLSRVKLIAEPWDVGPGGYQLGQLPNGWSEWNDRYRDTVRKFWRGDDGMLPEFAKAVHGSSDLFEDRGRPPQASINLITSHDGFTLRDMLSYEDRHNEANLEDNRDGHQANFSFNNGVEGDTVDADVLRKRNKQQRNLLTTLFVSQGVPMMLAGDEAGRTQNGNNNSYCQDNEISWMDWQNRDEDLYQFVCRLSALRKKHREFSCEKFIHGRFHEHYQGLDEIDWYHPGGLPMSPDDWNHPSVKAVGLMIHGALLYDDPSAQLIYVVFNAEDRIVDATLPVVPLAGVWTCEITSAVDSQEKFGRPPGATFELEDNSVYVFVFTGQVE